MFQVQLDAALGSDPFEETGAVEAALGQATHEVTNVQLAIAELSFQFHGALVVHHVGIAIHLAVGRTDRCLQGGSVTGGVALCRHAMGAILVIARSDGDLHR